MGVLNNLKPERVFYYFEEICKIPHGSGDTSKISDFCERFAIEHKLDYVREEIGNVIIKKSATVGKEDSLPVIIQGHLDMVCEKNPYVVFDFYNDSIEVNTDGEFVFANGTTLGGDDGIAVAMALAILESDDIAHPALEVLFTVDEETGMYGAGALDGSLFRGSRLINIDSEEEGIFTVSCAGGVRAELTVPVIFEDNSMPCYKITIDGLQGGHSGVEIHKGRLNANKVAASLLLDLGDVRIVSINGGLKDNAIPAHSQIIVATEMDIENAASEFAEKNRIETDNNLSISVVKTNTYDKAMSFNSSKKVADFLHNVPNGIIKWSDDIEGLVETSLNLGVLKTEENCISASFALRSSVNAEKMALLDKLEAFVKNFDGEIFSEAHYPAWEYKKDSFLRDTMVKVYEEMYGDKPQVVAIHAGLECGLLSEKIDGLDAVSIGPNMMDIHTPREKISVASVERVYKYLLRLLEVL
ncbi:MAG: aminoacyl-histidine dipeptidase [Ruminococcaceae bacterium]|nr:aminoacyl-histidine dipeptidase [Oscillospiraceae bacterium]